MKRRIPIGAPGRKRGDEKKGRGRRNVATTPAEGGGEDWLADDEFTGKRVKDEKQAAGVEDKPE